MSDYTLDDYSYNQKLRLYNSEGRENVGMNNIWDAAGKHWWDTQGSTVGIHNIDVTQPPSEPRIVCSFKNGYTIRMTWDNYDPGSGNIHTEYKVDIKLQMYDNNDSAVSSHYFSNYVGFLRTASQSPTNSTLYYYPPGFDYNLFATGDHPRDCYTGGTIFTWSGTSINPLETKPDIVNNVVDAGKAQDWYSKYDYHLYSNFKDLMDTLGDGSTPKKPEDDTSDPDPTDPTPDPDYTDPSYPVPFPPLPTGDGISTGFIKVYTPSAGQLQTLAGVLWSDSFVDTIKKIQNDPMEAIISLHSVPYSLVGTNAECRIGNFNTGVTMPAISTQYYKLNLGNIFVPEKWSSALDYSPYNSVDLFIPYVGIRSIMIDDIVNKTINMSANTDVVSGATVISVMCGNSVLYSYDTNMVTEHTFSQSSHALLYQSIMSGIGTIASEAAKGGIGGAVGGGLSSAINVALSKHSTVSRGGSTGGVSGALNTFTPYLIFHRPKQSLASGFKHFKGYPSNITTTLGSISGYTEVEHVHLNGIVCTDSERDEIRNLLKNGVIL